MAYFAELDPNNIVLRVVAINNQDCLDENNVEQEQIGINRCFELFQGGTWIQTSYNTIGNIHSQGKTPFRKNYASIGFIYDKIKSAFIPPKPEGDGWILNEEMCLWLNPEQNAQESLTESIRQQYAIGVDRV